METGQNSLHFPNPFQKVSHDALVEQVERFRELEVTVHLMSGGHRDLQVLCELSRCALPRTLGDVRRDRIGRSQEL